MKRLAAVAMMGMAMSLVAARAEIYELPPAGNDVIGATSVVTARHEDTLLDIARRHGLGYEDIVRANPGVNIWVPAEGTQVILPTRFVLPPGPREGIILNLAEYRLYYFPKPSGDEPAYVMTYPISIGRMDWATPQGLTKIISKVRDPSWYPPDSVREEHAAEGRPLPRVVPPGPDNPLGKFAMRLGLPGYLIHGTNRPAGVGMRVSHGCIRMFPEDIEYLFGQIALNTPVRIINEPVKMGWDGDDLVMEVHPVLAVAVPEEDAAASGEQSDADAGDSAPPAEPGPPAVRDLLTYVTEQFIGATEERSGQLDWDLAERIVATPNGMPTTVGWSIKNAATSAALE